LTFRSCSETPAPNLVGHGARLPRLIGIDAIYPNFPSSSINNCKIVYMCYF
jgi:hypothetical protein